MSKPNSAETSQVVAKLHERGIMVPANLDSDKEWPRCPTADKPKKSNGTYKILSHAPLRVWYRNRATGDSGVVSSDGKKEQFSKKEQREIEQHIKDSLKKQRKRQAEAAEKANRMYEVGRKCKTHPYLEKKSVKPCAGLKIRISTGNLMIPYYDEDGAITTVQFIDDDGFKLFLKGSKKAGSYFPIGDIDGSNPILICEGLSTGLSLNQSTGYPTVVAGDAGNLSPVAKKIKALYPDRTIILCADNDIHADGSPNRGIVDAYAAAFAIKALVAVPELESGKDCDFNNVHQTEGAERVVELVNRAALPFDMPEVAPLPKDYSYRPAGEHLDLFFNELRLGHALFILGEARDSKSDDWGKLMGWKDKDGKWHEEFIPNTDFVAGTAAWLKTLARGGWVTVSKLREPIAGFVDAYSTPTRIQLIRTTGWIGNVYVFPTEVIGEISGERPLIHPKPSRNPFEKKGTLKNWQKTIGAWAKGNSRMTFAISAVLAAFLLKHYRAGSVIFNFYGYSSRGKTTSNLAAASCCGCGSEYKGYTDSWLTTANALEELAALHTDSPLILEEMAKADAKVIAEAAYIIAGGQGKNRRNIDPSLQVLRQWRTIALSSSESTFSARLKEAGLPVRAGQLVRFLEIPAPEDTEYGFFEDIHDHKSSEAFAKAVQQAAVTNYGHLAPAFVERLIKAGHDKIEVRLKAYLDNAIDKLCPDDAEGQVKRVAGHFALCAFAGKLATKWKLLPWETGDAFRAAKSCFQGWLATRGTTGAMEDKALMERVKLFIQQSGKRYEVTVKGKTKYMLRPAEFEVACQGTGTKKAAEVLYRNGMLEKDGNGYMIKPPSNFLGAKRPRCYAISIPNEDE